jgi:tetratricopeptide (TPR) repeat protein
LEALECSSDPEAVNAVQKYYSEFVGDESEGEQEPNVSTQKNTSYDLSNESAPAEEPIKIPAHRSTREYVEAASNLIDEEEYSQAYVQCRLALFADPYNSDAFNMLGIIHEEDEAYRQAYFCYKQAVSCDPSFEEARSNLDELVREFGGENANVQTLISDLETGEEDLIYDAVVNLGESNNPEATEHLLAVLKNPSRKIVLASIESLANLHAVEAAESIASLYTDLWFFPVSPDKMTLDQIEKTRAQCITDWADRCKIILALGKLGSTSWLLRSLEREFSRLKQLLHSFTLVGIDDFKTIHQVTLDLALYILEKYITSDKLTSLGSEMMSKLTENGINKENVLKYSEIPALIEKVSKK